MKLVQFQKKLNRHKIDFAVLMNSGLRDKNLFYFTGIDLEHGILLVPRNKKPVFLVSSLEYERTKKFSRVKNVKLIRNWKESERFLLHYLKNKTIGMNLNFVPLNLMNRIRKISHPKKIKDISDVLVNLRSSKTKEEIERIKKACRISAKIFKATIKNFKFFKTEMNVVSFMENEMRKNNVMPSFPIIVASGKNASMPHHEPEGKLNKGFCIIDFGVVYKGYSSDLTRTICLGKPSKKERETYNFLLRMQKNAINSLKCDDAILEFGQKVRKNFGKYEKYFIHGLGHPLGIDVHDVCGKKYEENSVFTIEPGIYVEGKFGMRIEDDILVTKKGAVVLSNVKKDLIVINK